MILDMHLIVKKLKNLNWKPKINFQKDLKTFDGI